MIIFSFFPHVQSFLYSLFNFEKIFLIGSLKFLCLGICKVPEFNKNYIQNHFKYFAFVFNQTLIRG